MRTDDLLTAAEMDALLSAVATGDINVESPASAGDWSSPSYDFRQPRPIMSGMVPTLDMINDGFLAAMRTGCFDLLQLHVELSSGALQMLALRDYLASLPTPSSIHLVHVPQLGGTALITLEPHLVACLVDAFFGGGKRTLPDRQRSEFTAAEQRIVAKFLVQLLGALRQGWSPVAELSFELQSTEYNPAYVRLSGCSDAEAMVMRVVNLELPSGSASFHILIPYMLIEPMRTNLSAVVQSPGQRGAATEVPRNSALAQALGDVDVIVDSSLLSTEITVEELHKLAPGQVIPVEQMPSVTLSVDGVPVYRGVYGVVGNSRAIQITQAVGRT